MSGEHFAVQNHVFDERVNFRFGHHVAVRHIDVDVFRNKVSHLFGERGNAGSTFRLTARADTGDKSFNGVVYRGNKVKVLKFVFAADTEYSLQIEIESLAGADIIQTEPYRAV